VWPATGWNLTLSYLHVSTLLCHPQEFVVSTLPSYTSVSVKCLAEYLLRTPWGWHTIVETCRRGVIVYHLIVPWLITVQNNKRCTVQSIEIKKNPRTTFDIYRTQLYFPQTTIPLVGSCSLRTVVVHRKLSLRWIFVLCNLSGIGQDCNTDWKLSIRHFRLSMQICDEFLH